MEFVPLLVLLATVKKVVDFARYARGRDANGMLTQTAAWAGGIVLTMLAAQTAWAEEISFGGQALADLNLASQVFAGIAVGSTASLASDAVTRAAPPPLVASGGAAGPAAR